MTQTLYERAVPVDELRHYYCQRCGIEIPANTIQKRMERGSENRECSDCTAMKNHRPIQMSKTGCRPWTGEIDLDTMSPIDSEGRPVSPGFRKCGHNDCMNRNHIFSNEAAIAEQFSITYRTGIKLTYQELVKAVKAEARA